MKDSFLIKLLYNTFLGRALLKLLVNPRVSKVAACFLSSRFSAWLVPVFIRKNQIDMKYYKIPQGGYRSFNEFFTRHKKEDYVVREEGTLLSPCDGLLTVSEIDEKQIFHIKHTAYSLKELLKNSGLADEFQGGTAFIFRLTPAHYHRYSYSVTGRIVSRKRIAGVLHSVQPVCHEKEKVFVQNTRDYVVIKNEVLGKVVQMEVGALLVGKISNHGIRPEKLVNHGEEKGYFEYGGSSIVVLVKEKIRLSENILHRMVDGKETPVKMGEKLTEM